MSNGQRRKGNRAKGNKRSLVFSFIDRAVTEIITIPVYLVDVKCLYGIVADFFLANSLSRWI